ncbi:MAG: tryptophan synthase subunit alpha, partial [Proteobacteria bacterium]|nr:tryptophan synthase subunit alpha [Pseudomonadota bacterium]
FVAYITAGDPSGAVTVELVAALERAGVDIVEIGVPFSDPIVDGPIIQAASGRALAAGTTLATTFEMVRAIRQRSQLPLVLYSYLNPLLRFGIDAAAAAARAAGIDGMLTVDLPVGAAPEVTRSYRDHGLDPVFLITPTTSPARRALIAEQARGFLYLVALRGVTGVQDASADAIAPLVADVRRLTDVPIAVGVGIKRPDQVASIGRVADAVIVGSALVAVIGEHAGAADLVARLERAAGELVDALPTRG